MWINPIATMKGANNENRITSTQRRADMKYILAILLCVPMFAQNKMNEQDAINKSHIDFTKQYLYFIVHGRVEIDGHTFLNDTCNKPIIFKATIDGVELTDSTNTYTHRKCSHPNCDIIHLEIKTNYLPSPKQWWQGGTTITPLYLK